MRIVPQFQHMLIIHAVLEHDVSLEDVARAGESMRRLGRSYGGYQTGEN